MKGEGTEVNQQRQQVSVIVPTIDQTSKVHEVVVADGSSTGDTESLLADPVWADRRLSVRRVAVQPPNAVRQRQAAIAESTGKLLLFLDDDVVLEPNCVRQMLVAMQQSTDIVGVFADFTNQAWPMPTRAWRLYLRYVLGMKEDEWQGKVVGPLLRFGYNPSPATDAPIEWMGTCNTMVRSEAYESVGGFSKFFLHRSTMNEDVDLGIKLTSVGRIVFCPTARMAHYHAPSGRVSPLVAAEDDLYNRYFVLRCTRGWSAVAAFTSVLSFFAIETLSNVLGSAFRFRENGILVRFVGRLRALARVSFGRSAINHCASVPPGKLAQTARVIR
jgi:GT2 family glycosyltransferase